MSALSSYGSTFKDSNSDPFIRVEPQKYINFLCGNNQTVGILKIFIEQENVPEHLRMNRNQYEFSLKTTNKKNYRVSQPYGYIVRSPHIIYINLRQVSSLEDTLKDKFKLTIVDNKKMQVIFTAKLGIVIQSNLSTIKDDNSDQSSSRLNSIYTTPSFMNEGSSLPSTFFNSTIANSSALSMRKGRSFSFHAQKQQNTRDLLNESIQEVENKKRRLLVLERDLHNKQARSRFVIYLAFAAIVTGLLLGIYAGIQIGNEGIIGLVRSSSKKLGSYIDSSI